MRPRGLGLGRPQRPRRPDISSTRCRRSKECPQETRRGGATRKGKRSERRQSDWASERCCACSVQSLRAPSARTLSIPYQIRPSTFSGTPSRPERPPKARLQRDLRCGQARCHSRRSGSHGSHKCVRHPSRVLGSAFSCVKSREKLGPAFSVGFCSGRAPTSSRGRVRQGACREPQ